MLPLGKGEGVRFAARKDAEDNWLRGDCRYTMQGHMPNHALWTVQVRNPVTRQVYGHVESGQMLFGPNGEIDLTIAPQVQPGNWLNTDGLERIELLLTLYDTNAFSKLGSEEIALPQLVKEAC
nr:DUF1214 domain-containing protein [Maritalea mediterranea]